MNAREYWAWLRARVLTADTLWSLATGAPIGGMIGAAWYFAGGGQ
ncbi:hypothetical protein C8K38_111234 [Rhodococcus sp. OK611]|nr:MULTISPECIES: hypothetical protein [unclassified Rhodococcus (in: high G+C Gram-positive bacteria)]PTR42065.1 hypothetical protein C8K38_111234 [Rhodococcus sp. OK611]SNX91488.1 hypothetical protein SAMN05447004_11023 [Rhodococcus sp. OK270]